MSNAYDIISDNRKQIVDRIIAQMEEGELFWKKTWVESSLPHNPLTGAVYKGANRLRLLFDMHINGYSDTRYVTYAQAKKQGWNIKPGAKGIFCEKWTYYKLESIEDEETGETKKVVSRYDRPRVSYFYLFSAENVEGIPPFVPPEPVLKQDENEIADTLIRASPCPVHEDTMSRAFYSPSKDFIHLPLRDYFDSGTDFITTALHEMIHSTGHPSRLNRINPNSVSDLFGSPGYAKEELVAELGSVFAAADIGIQELGEHYENHAAYLQSWLKALKSDPNELFIAASKAERASDYITERYMALLPAKLPEVTEVAKKKTVEELFAEAGISADKPPVVPPEVEAQIMAERMGKLKL